MLAADICVRSYVCKVFFNMADETGEKHRAVEKNSSESALARAINSLERSVNLLGDCTCK